MTTTAIPGLLAAFNRWIARAIGRWLPRIFEGYDLERSWPTRLARHDPRNFLPEAMRDRVLRASPYPYF